MISFVLGTRPEIIKLAPLIRRTQENNIPFQLIHSGQHYDDALDGVFFRDLRLPDPHHNLRVGSASHAEMIGVIMKKLEEIWKKESPSVVIVEGDTNTVFAAAFIAQRMRIPVAHVEAGLRSDDWEMPEESNRVLTDRLSDRLYAPTQKQERRLLLEGIEQEKVLVTGNTIADAVKEHGVYAKDAALPGSIQQVIQRPFALVTLHRPALVDNAERLCAVLDALDAAFAKADFHGVFLAHPRTQKQLSSIVFEQGYTSVHDPVGYLPMLSLLQKAKMICTDSGGLQEEAALLHLPCVTVRENTERPETIEAGGNVLVGFDVEKIQKAIEGYLNEEIIWKSLYAVENPSDTIMKDLLTHYV